MPHPQLITRDGGTIVDTSAKVGAAKALEMRGAGLQAIWRYVFFGPARPGDLDSAELQGLLAAGLLVLVVCHVPLPGWHADEGTGTAHALSACANAARAGYVTPDESTELLALGLDMEGVGNPGPDSFAYARAGCRVRSAHRYRPMVYVGYDSGLTSADLDALSADPTCGDPLFWCDFAPLRMRPTPAVGYVLHQGAQTTLCGVGVDPDAFLFDGALYGLADVDSHTELAA